MATKKVACDKCGKPNDRCEEGNYCSKCAKEYQDRIAKDPEQKPVGTKGSEP